MNRYEKKLEEELDARISQIEILIDVLGTDDKNQSEEWVHRVQ